MKSNEKMLRDKFIPILCACFIVFLEAFALYKEVNGITLSLAIGGLTGIGGYTIRGMVGR